MSGFLSHGKTEVVVIGNVVHTYLEGGFNVEGIKSYETAVLNAKPSSDDWKLIDHAKDKAGITPDAMAELKRVFQNFIQQGCVCIAEDINSTFAMALQKYVLDDISIPNLITDCEYEAHEFVSRI